MEVSKDNPLRATITPSKRGTKYRDTRNVEALKKFHKCADEPHKSGCKADQRKQHKQDKKDKKTTEKKHGDKVHQQSVKFGEIKKKYALRGKNIGKWKVSKRNKDVILRALTKDRASLDRLGVDEKKLVTNWVNKTKQNLKKLVKDLE